MRSAFFVLMSFCCFASYGQTVQEWETSVSPLPDEDILRACDYRMVIPGSDAQVRAAWIVFDRGQDYLKWYEDRRVRAFAGAHQLAFVLAMHCRSKEREDMIVLPEKGVGRSLFTALDQLAESSGHGELKTVRIIAMGWSGAGSLVGRLAAFRTERFLAGIDYAPGQYEPLGMDTIELPHQAMSRPQLIIANGGDDHVGTERPYAYFRKYFDRGAPWTFAVQNRVPHCCLQNAETLILDWLHGILTTDGRGATEQGYLTITFSRVVDGWKRPTFNATSSRVGPKGGAKSGELPAGWMPSATFAQEWLALTGRANPVAVWKP